MGSRKISRGEGDYEPRPGFPASEVRLTLEGGVTVTGRVDLRELPGVAVAPGKYVYKKPGGSGFTLADLEAAKAEVVRISGLHDMLVGPANQWLPEELEAAGKQWREAQVRASGFEGIHRWYDELVMRGFRESTPFIVTSGWAREAARLGLNPDGYLVCDSVLVHPIKPCPKRRRIQTTLKRAEESRESWDMFRLVACARPEDDVLGDWGAG